MKKKILVIDDDPLAQEMIVAALEGEGYTAMAALTFEDALRKARQKHPGLILIAAGKKDISGFEGCRKFKELFQPHPPPVIIMTGNINMVDPIRARTVGADDFVVKTTDMSNLIQGVRKIFSA